MVCVVTGAAHYGVRALSMLGRLLGDWKFLLTLAVAVAGVVGPFWLWRADQSGKSVSVELISQVPLRPSEKDAVPGLQIAIDGVPLADPYFSVVKVINSGDKPIPTADFESPLEIRPPTETAIAGARITAKAPEDIEAEIAWDKQSVRLKPTLLNPRDTVTVSIITSGGRPSFSTKARIVGVASVQIVDATAPASNPWKRWLLLLAAIAFAVPAMAAIRRIDTFARQKQTVVLRKRTVYAIVAVMGMAATFSCMAFLNTYSIDSFWPVWLSSMLFFFACIYHRLKARPNF